MKMHILVIRDIKANVFGSPFFHPNIGAALRNFGDQVNHKDDNNPLYKHPDDFELYKIGEYDDADATILPSKPEQLALASNYKTA